MTIMGGICIMCGKPIPEGITRARLTMAVLRGSWQGGIINEKA